MLRVRNVVRGDAVGRGTALQAGSSRVQFSMVSSALGLTQPLTEMSTWGEGGW